MLPRVFSQSGATYQRSSQSGPTEHYLKAARLTVVLPADIGAYCSFSCFVLNNLLVASY